MEPPKVTDIPLYQLLLTFRCEILPNFTRWGWGAVTEGICDHIDPRGVVPPDPVRDRIHKLEVVRESAGGDLVIVIWVAPSTEPARRGVVEDT